MCGSTRLTRVWSFGLTPLANAYMPPFDAAQGKPEAVEEAWVALNVYYCEACSLVQLRDVVDPKVLFDHYLYVSSTSPTFVQHFEDYAASLIERFSLTEKDFVVDVGSNDGILLKPLQAAGVRVLGVDPAANVAQIANAEGVPTRADYFTPTVAREIAAEQGKARVITANNVFAHTDGVDVFTEAVKELLAEDGVFVFEVQYLGDLITNNLFDIVYHEHVNYYSVHPLIRFFENMGMDVFDVERVPVHGGSIRVFVTPSPPAGGLPLVRGRTKRLQQLLTEEQEQRLTTVRPYQQFAARIADNKQKLRALLTDIAAAGKRVVGYGAPAKATTLCYAFGLNREDLDYVIDDSPLKQGLVMPGTHIPIVGPEALYEHAPDYCLILAWNFAEPIMQNHQRFTEAGGKWIIPVPEPKIV